MTDPLYDLPSSAEGMHRPVYSLDDATDVPAAGGWSPAPVGSRRWAREQEPASPLTGERSERGFTPASAHAPGSAKVFDLPAPTQSPAWPPSSYPSPQSWSAPTPAADAASAPASTSVFELPAPTGGLPVFDLDAAPAPTAAPIPAAVRGFDPQGAAVHVALAEHAATKADKDLIEALCQVVAQGGSDLHVTVDAPPTLRVDGSLRPAISPTPWSRDKVRGALTSLLTPDRLDEFDRELELDFAYTISDESRFRVNFFQQRGSLGAVFRLIPTEIKTLEQLGIDPDLGKFAGLPRGLVLVTGPTGSGKSTTLAALIDLANSTRADHIVTVEDPIEFMHNHKKSIVNQREVGGDTHSFANALKHVLRQDPDVILIGELRDLETISVALTAAETGHLVFATLHTQDAAQTIDRVIDVFPPHQQDQVRTQLASTLQGVVCQTLVPRASGKGRVVATEVMMMTPAVGNLIREGKTYQIASSMQAGRDLGMHTMDQDLADLVNSGTVTLKAAMEKVHDEEGFHRLVTRASTGSDTGLADNGIDFGDAFSGGHH
jgi:pilus retraction protein PilT